MPASRTPASHAFDRILWIVLDSVGIGELPDAAQYGDAGRDTLGHIARSRPLALPHLVHLGLAHIKPPAHLEPAASPAGCCGKGATGSPGKDTTTGHWEMVGIWLESAFPVYPRGFPPPLIEEFERQIGRRTLGNKPASGTTIIEELGAEHMSTGFPIVYTSGDSVFQIAAHEQVIPVPSFTASAKLPENFSTDPIALAVSSRVLSQARRETSGAPSAATTTPSSRPGRCCSMFSPVFACLSSASGKFTISITAAG